MRYMAVVVGVWAVIYLAAGLRARYLGCRGIFGDCYIAEAQPAKDLAMVLLCLIALFGILILNALMLWRYFIWMVER